MSGEPVKANKMRFCPYDGNLLTPKTKHCSRCSKTVNLQQMAPRKPRNFYEKMPEGISDNYTDDLFLSGLVHKSKYISFFCDLNLFGVIDSFPTLHYLPMIRETAEVINCLNTLGCFIVSLLSIDSHSSLFPDYIHLPCG